MGQWVRKQVSTVTLRAGLEETITGSKQLDGQTSKTECDADVKNERGHSVQSVTRAADILEKLSACKVQLILKSCFPHIFAANALLCGPRQGVSA